MKSNKEKFYFLPFKSELMEVAEALGNVTICKYAMMTLFRLGKFAWETCKGAVDNGTIPEHGLKGKSSGRSKKFKKEVEPGLIDFFEKVVLPLSGPRPTRATGKESGAVIRDPEWTKRRLFGKYCFDLENIVSSKVRVEQSRSMYEWTKSGSQVAPKMDRTAPSQPF